MNENRWKRKQVRRTKKREEKKEEMEEAKNEEEGGVSEDPKSTWSSLGSLPPSTSPRTATNSIYILCQLYSMTLDPRNEFLRTIPPSTHTYEGHTDIATSKHTRTQTNESSLTHSFTHSLEQAPAALNIADHEVGNTCLFPLLRMLLPSPPPLHHLA